MSKSDNCTDCKFYKHKLYSKSEKHPDSRCLHYSSHVGKEMDSYLTISEARLPPTKRQVEGRTLEVFERVRPYNQCGPEAMFFEWKKA